MRNFVNKDTSKCRRFLRATPLLFVLAGSVLTVVGNTSAIKSCKIAGPVVIAVGGLLLLAIIVWNSRQDQLTENDSENCEPSENIGSASNDELGPIHHFEVKVPFDFSGKEMVPPSYEEAVNNNDIKYVQNNTVGATEEQELNSDNANSSTPPSARKAT